MKEDVWVPTLDESHLQEEANHSGLSQRVVNHPFKKCAHVRAEEPMPHVSCTLSWGTTAPRAGHQIVAPEKTVVFAYRRPH